MSQWYRIAVAEGVQRVVHVEDGVTGTLELLPILPAERMGTLLAEALAQRGFTQGQPGVWVRVQGDVLTAVRTDTGSVTVSIAEDRTLTVNTRVHGEGASAEAARADAARRLTGALEAEVAPFTDAAQRAVTARLEQELAAIRPDLDAAVTAATAAALLERARELGQIESVEGSAEAGTLTITVRV